MKKNFWNKFATGAVIVLAAGLVRAGDSMSPTNHPRPLDVPLTNQQFVSDAATAGMLEVYLSQMALDKSTNTDVRMFAQRMVKDHSAANKKLQKLAQQKNWGFPATNTFGPEDPNWNNPLVAKPEVVKSAELLMMTNVEELAGYRAIKHLRSLEGAEFDNAFWEGMRGDHMLVVNEFELAAQNLADPDLKKFAQKTLPTLQRHYQMVQGHMAGNHPTTAPMERTPYFNVH